MVLLDEALSKGMKIVENKTLKRACQQIDQNTFKILNLKN
jgi:hypothetical protein